MAQSLSPLQKDILAALEEFPALEEVMHTGDLLQWARPSQIMQRLALQPTPSNRVALSKALHRLYVRGRVAKMNGRFGSRGKCFR